MWPSEVKNQHAAKVYKGVKNEKKSLIFYKKKLKPPQTYIIVSLELEYSQRFLGYNLGT